MNLSRRCFLVGAAASAAALSAQALAIGPISRSGRNRLKLSLAAYSMRQALTAKPGDAGAMDLPGFIDYAASLDVDGVELTSYFFAQEVTPDYLAGLKRQCHHLGLDISGGAIRNNFTLTPGSPELQKEMDHTETWMKHYAAIGAPVMRVFAGVPPKGISEQQGIANAIENMKRACDMAGKHGVILGLENHDFLTHIDRLMPIIAAVDSPWFGVNFDSGNISGAADPYAEMARIAPYTVNAQIKVEVPVNGQKQPTDLNRAVKLLFDAGYRGHIVLEYEAREDPRETIPKHLAGLREAMAKVMG